MNASEARALSSANPELTRLCNIEVGEFKLAIEDAAPEGRTTICFKPSTMEQHFHLSPIKIAPLFGTGNSFQDKTKYPKLLAMVCERLEQEGYKTYFCKHPNQHWYFYISLAPSPSYGM